MEAPTDVEIQPVEGGETVVRCCERHGDKTIGELEVAVFKAALVIDRDGILEEKARDAADHVANSEQAAARVAPTVPVSMPGASGYRADVELVRPMGATRPQFPYVYVFAMAPHDLGVDGGVLVTVRCATADWPAADAILKSLRLLGRRGTTANDTTSTPPIGLPVVGKRED